MPQQENAAVPVLYNYAATYTVPPPPLGSNYLSSLNLAIPQNPVVFYGQGATLAQVCSQPQPVHPSSVSLRNYPKKYQRTQSFDESYGIYGAGGSLTPISITPSAPIYAASSFYGAPSSEEPIYGINAHIYPQAATYYKPLPVAHNFDANSCVGSAWYRRTMPARFRPDPRHTEASYSNPLGVVNGHTHAANGSMLNMQQNIYDQGLTGIPSDNLSTVAGKDLLAIVQPSPEGQAPSFANSAGTASDESPRRKKQSRIRTGLIISVLVIMIAVLVAMGVAIYSQVRTHNSVLKYVRQSQGRMLVTGGTLVSFSPQLLSLLDKNSQEFQQMSTVFAQRFDLLFNATPLREMYEGTQVNAFQFIQALPALEVNFIVRTNANYQLEVPDLLLLFHDALQHDTTGAFGDVTIDPDSISIENRSIKDLQPRSG